MTARIDAGWLTIPYSGHDLAKVEIDTGQGWRPAFLDWYDGARVAKIRPPRTTGLVKVRIRVNGHASDAGRVVV